MTLRLQLLVIAVLLSLWGVAASSKYLPVVLWHGMGATCCATGHTSDLQKLIEKKLGVFVLSISTGGSEATQVYAGFFGSVASQVEATCKIIAETEELKGGYNGIGLSQGGLFMRAVVETCQHKGPRMNTLVTLGAPHQGVMNVPLCTGLPAKSSYWTCRAMQKLLDWGAYLPYIRSHVVQAQYFRDPYNVQEYLEKNPFLPDINNERDVKSDQYRDNLASLQRLVLYRFEGDFTVVPRDSAWFSTFDGEEMVPLNETDLYMHDYIGLRQLDKLGRLDLQSFAGIHMHFSYEEFEEQVLWKYLANSSASTQSWTA